MSVRSDVVSEQIRQLVSSAVHFELRDPRLQDVTITRVKVSPDLQFADIRFASLTEERDPNLVLTGLNKAKGALKRYVAHRLKLRKIPEFRFHVDEDLIAEQRIGELLKDLHVPDEPSAD